MYSVPIHGKSKKMYQKEVKIYSPTTCFGSRSYWIRLAWHVIINNESTARFIDLLFSIVSWEEESHALGGAKHAETLIMADTSSWPRVAGIPGGYVRNCARGVMTTGLGKGGRQGFGIASIVSCWLHSLRIGLFRPSFVRPALRWNLKNIGMGYLKMKNTGNKTQKKLTHRQKMRLC